MIASISCCLLLGCFAETRRFNFDHKFSIGLRSGLFPGHGRTSTPLSESHFIHTRAVWHGAPSCWNKNGTPSPNRLRAEGSSFGCRTSLMYFLEFMIPSMTCNRPTPFHAMHPHTITPRGCFIVGVRHAGRHSSPGRLLT